MKKLCLLRHGAAETNYSYADDLIRPLTKVGRKDAALMAKSLKKYHFLPEIILASPAKRTQETAQIITEDNAISSAKIKIVKGIYEASQEKLLTIVQSLEDSFNNVMLVGHNPGLTMVIHYFSSEANNDLPTCGMTCLEFSIEHWAEVMAAKGKISFNICPDDMKS